MCSPPFNAANQKSLAVKIRDGRFRPLPECYSDELARCIGSMLRVQVRISDCDDANGLTVAHSEINVRVSGIC